MICSRENERREGPLLLSKISGLQEVVFDCVLSIFIKKSRRKIQPWGLDCQMELMIPSLQIYATHITHLASNCTHHPSFSGLTSLKTPTVLLINT